MPPVTLVSRSLPTSSTLALEGGRWPPGPPCWSSPAGGGPSAGSWPRAWSGTDAPAAPAHSTRVSATTGKRKLLRNDIVLPSPPGARSHGALNGRESTFRKMPRQHRKAAKPPYSSLLLGDAGRGRAGRRPPPSRRGRQAGTGEPMIVCEGVEKWFDAFQALRGVDLAVGRQEVV